MIPLFFWKILTAFYRSFENTVQYFRAFSVLIHTTSSMRFLSFTFSLYFILGSFTSPLSYTKKDNPISPLAAYSDEWNDPKYLKCNTAARAGYMSPAEKKVIYILNMARMNPGLFARTVINKYPDEDYTVSRNSTYYKSLARTMISMKPVSLLYPDSLCFNGAQCHAIYSGAAGYVGHERQTVECRTKWYYNGECCDYGHDDPLDIIMSLLIDEGVESLGHRDICLSPYKSIGVSIQPHKVYRYNAVLDFHY
jgi:uncharacterized protein YkwD